MKCVIKILLVCENDYNMTQDEKWMIRYDEVVGFIEANHRNPSKHRVEEHLMLNWVKQQRKLMNAGKLKPERNPSLSVISTKRRAWRDLFAVSINVEKSQ